jgi:glyceraldehyde-3-phosphate dehydrogenase/erythrose-4-phosphate dehydrogenase
VWVAKVVNETVGIVHGSITTMHCITNTQPLVDAVVGKKQDFRRCRSGLANMAPTSTNSATAIGMIYPELLGKLNGHAVRVPLQVRGLDSRVPASRTFSRCSDKPDLTGLLGGSTQA